MFIVTRPLYYLLGRPFRFADNIAPGHEWSVNAMLSFGLESARYMAEMRLIRGISVAQLQSFRRVFFKQRLF